MKLNKKNLPFYAATVQTVQYSFAGWLYFSWVGVPVVGSMGALISFSVAYAASQISDIAKGRKLASWVAMVFLMVLSPVIIGTSLFYTLDIITNPIWRGIVAGVWGLLPDGATALAGFVAGKGLVEREQKPVQPPQNVARAKSAKGKKSQSEIICRYAGAGCGRKFASQNAANAHARSCGFKPTISMPVDVTNEMTK